LFILANVAARGNFSHEGLVAADFFEAPVASGTRAVAAIKLIAAVGEAKAHRVDAGVHYSVAHVRQAV